MSKKRKLNSKNPKYWDKSLLKETKGIRKLECITHNGVKVYSVWHTIPALKYIKKSIYL